MRHISVLTYGLGSRVSNVISSAKAACADADTGHIRQQPRGMHCPGIYEVKDDNHVSNISNVSVATQATFSCEPGLSHYFGQGIHHRLLMSGTHTDTLHRHMEVYTSSSMPSSVAAKPFIIRIFRGSSNVRLRSFFCQLNCQGAFACAQEDVDTEPSNSKPNSNSNSN